MAEVVPKRADFHERIDLPYWKEPHPTIEVAYEGNGQDLLLKMACEDTCLYTSWDTADPKVRDDLNELIDMLTRLRDYVVVCEEAFW